MKNITTDYKSWFDNFAMIAGVREAKKFTNAIINSEDRPPCKFSKSKETGIVMISCPSVEEDLQVSAINWDDAWAWLMLAVEATYCFECVTRILDEGPPELVGIEYP